MKKPEEIVKALILCAKGKGCRDCPYYDDMHSEIVCSVRSRLDAADLLKTLLKDHSDHFANPCKVVGDQIRIGINVPRTTTALTYQYLYDDETTVNLILGQRMLGSKEIRKAMEEDDHG